MTKRMGISHKELKKLDKKWIAENAFLNLKTNDEFISEFSSWSSDFGSQLLNDGTVFQIINQNGNDRGSDIVETLVDQLYPLLQKAINEKGNLNDHPKSHLLPRQLISN